MGLCASQFCRHFVAGKFSRAPPAQLIFSCSSHGLPSKKDSKPFQARLKWFCHRRRFTWICGNLMLGLRSGCGSWSRSWSRWSPGPRKSSKWKWLTSCTSISEEKQVWKQQDLMERLQSLETQLRWGRVGKACASMHQLKLAELNEGKRFIIFPRASIPSVYPIFRHKWRIQQDAKHQSLRLNCEADPQRCCVR